jgi:NAD(P)-dependent dehydrogenase (short-subunit alcohol dehydrogenase family)
VTAARRGRVAGKVVLISGGARGQGASHGRLLAEQGARVVLGDILDGPGEETARRLRKDGLEVRYVHLDVTRPADWDAAVAAAERAHGRLDVLVNNAGLTGSASVVDCSLEEWQSVIAVNQTGVFLGIQRAVPAMRRAGGGSIINIASVIATLGTESMIAYQASKAAVHQLTRAAAVTLAPDIRVNTVTPGLVADTAMAAGLDQEWLQERLAAYPLGRGARMEEVSHAVLFLASDESSFTTGADLRVDGGALAGVKPRRPSGRIRATRRSAR